MFWIGIVITRAVGCVWNWHSHSNFAWLCLTLIWLLSWMSVMFTIGIVMT